MWSPGRAILAMVHVSISLEEAVNRIPTTSLRPQCSFLAMSSSAPGSLASATPMGLVTLLPQQNKLLLLLLLRLLLLLMLQLLLLFFMSWVVSVPRSSWYSNSSWSRTLSLQHESLCLFCALSRRKSICSTEERRKRNLCVGVGSSPEN
jgi:hypothetical protein